MASFNRTTSAWMRRQAASARRRRSRISSSMMFARPPTGRNGLQRPCHAARVAAVPAGEARRSQGSGPEIPLTLARSLGRHALVYGAGVMLQRVAGFLMLPLYTRRLDRADFGTIGTIDT